MLALSYMGPVAAPAAPALLGILEHAEEDEEVADAAEALGRIGHPAATPGVPLLIGGLSHRKIYVRGSCAEALGRIGPNAGAAVPALKERLQDEHYSVRTRAMRALRRIQSTGVETDRQAPGVR